MLYIIHSDQDLYKIGISHNPENKAILGKSEWFRLCPETLEWLDEFLNKHLTSNPVY